MKVRSVQGDSIDLICFRYYGRTTGVTEQVIEANPALVNIGPILPNGTEIYLPEQTTSAEKTTISLWD
jgi:phage tail protein X